MSTLVRDLRQHVCASAEAELMTDAANEIERLVAGIRKLLEEGPDRPRRGKCKHDQYGWEHCDNCYDEYLENLLLGAD